MFEIVRIRVDRLEHDYSLGYSFYFRNMRLFSLILLFTSVLQMHSFCQGTKGSWAEAIQNGKATLQVNFYENQPFFFTDKNNLLNGLEFEIIQEFRHWAKTTKQVNVELNFNQYTDFEKFYKESKSGQNATVGAGSVSMKKLRLKELKFSPAYLKNVAVLVSSLELNSLITLKELPIVFKGRIALVIKGSSHEKSINKLKKRYYPDLKIEYATSPDQILNTILSNPKYFGYVDLISYRNFANKKEGILRTHRIADQKNEYFGFIFPKNSDWQKAFNQFFKDGFYRMAEYHKIMDNYLDIQTINEVQIR